MNTSISFVDDLAGPLVISSWINCWLWGIEATQVFRYFRTYKQDSWLLKASILAVIINDSFGSLVICQDVYRWSVIDFGNPLGIAKLGWQAAAFALSTGISVIICQTYLVWRFYRVSNLLLGMMLMAACALAGLGYNLYVVIIVAHFKTLTDASRCSPIAQIFLSLEAATDVIISLGLVAFLWTHYNGTEFHNTKSLLRRLMVVSAESGTITTCFALLAVIMFSVKRDTNLGIGVAYTIGRVYSLTLLCNLNMRRAKPGADRGSDECVEETYKLDSCVRLKLPQVQIQTIIVSDPSDAPDHEKGSCRQEGSDKGSLATAV